MIFDVYEELDHPVMKALVAALTEPISEEVKALATTSFKKLCAAKPVAVNNAFFEESRRKS